MLAARASRATRHPALRASFTAEGRQVIHDHAAVHIRVRDLRSLPGRARQDSLAAYRHRCSHRMLPIDRPPLVRAEVSVLAEDRMVLHVSHDGLVLDGISMFLFFRDWWRAYAGEPLDEAGMPFGEYVAELARARDRAPAQRSQRYWLDRLDDLAPMPGRWHRRATAGDLRSQRTTHMAKFRLWFPIAHFAFAQEQTAIALEKYLKSKSGRAF